MKTRLISIFLLLMLPLTFALGQSPDKGKTSFAILGGVNFQNLIGKDNSGNTLENDMIVGYHAGVNIQMPITTQFFFQPGLLFTVKGADNTYGSLTGKYRISYLELPLNLVYKASLGKGSLMFGFGPYVAYGIGGKASIVSGGTTIETDIVFKNVVETGDALVPYVKTFDAGGNIFAGFELEGGLFLQFNAQLGMLNINPQDKRGEIIFGDELSVRNAGLGISLGFRF